MAKNIKEMFGSFVILSCVMSFISSCANKQSDNKKADDKEKVITRIIYQRNI